MYKPQSKQERVLHRLQIAQGHLKKVLNMVENNEYCIDVIHQSQAVQRALEEADALVLENHLNGCVVDHIKKGQAKKSIEEIMNVFKRQN